ncbi:O-antigen ligase family protein [Bordetella avium]|uniref:O-antigen polymerase n=1 Tax=Bordetella avium (strain 197N) TaxID=360910 RepID=Q2L1I7_BORA1|nr:O-antigen ligase family protein [Bordetella avium]AZY47799.1 O-antigen polymerase [Bordetella avium]AZY51170.1 O-antigen polymerase [Bordetella avium]RIQ14974.1 O-antigen ligase family protein [Bordetella avium]RIQ41437.1 O-antigen ligase family protein [Bordetella avium]RIQ45773.1 O-antigen ligase family protein [Bordetella avium]
MLKRLPSWLLVAVLAATPTLLLITASGGSTAFYLTLLLSIAALGCREQALDLSAYRKLIVAACLPLAAMLLIAVLHGSLSSINLERGLRLALGMPLLLAGLQATGPQRLKHVLWGTLAAGWVAIVSLIALIGTHLSERPLTPEYNAVSYGNLLLLFGVINLFSLSWPLTRYRRSEIAFKLLTTLVTFAGFIITQTRSGWLALPIFVALALLVYARFRHPLRLFAALIVVLAGLIAVGSLSPALVKRVELGRQQLTECEANPLVNSSICVRLQLWRAAWGMMLDNPIKGVGASGFSPALQKMAAEGKVSPYVAEDFGEPHNDMLDALALYGIPGGLALLLLYAIPAVFFLRRLAYDLPQQVRAAAAMGASTSLGFAAFGLTELMFRGMRTLGLYVILIALFAVLSSAANGARASKKNSPGS